MELDSEGKITEYELVLTVQGIVEQVDLPPYTGTVPHDKRKWSVAAYTSYFQS